MVTVTLAGSPEEVHSEARAFFGLAPAAPVASPVVELKEVSKPKVEKVAKTEKVEKVEPISEKAPASIPPVDADVFAQIQAIIPKVMAEIKREGMVKLFEKYGAKNSRDLKASDHVAFLAEAKSLIPA